VLRAPVRSELLRSAFVKIFFGGRDHTVACHVTLATVAEKVKVLIAFDATSLLLSATTQLSRDDICSHVTYRTFVRQLQRFP
jgi:hypothetical protein